MNRNFLTAQNFLWKLIRNQIKPLIIRLNSSLQEAGMSERCKQGQIKIVLMINSGVRAWDEF